MADALLICLGLIGIDIAVFAMLYRDWQWFRERFSGWRIPLGIVVTPFGVVAAALMMMFPGDS